MKNRPSYAIASVDHALLLATVLQMEGPLTVSEAAERIGVARSTAHRLLSMLCYRDFAVQDEDRRYRSGPVLARAVTSGSRTAHLRAVALPRLHELTERVKETTNLSVLSGDQVRFIASVECDHVLRVGTREGMAFPAHLTSGGPAMLAELPRHELEALYDESRWLDRPAERPNLAALRRQLALVRERGFAINDGRTEKGLVAIGRAIQMYEGCADAAVSISMPSARFSRSRLPELVRELVHATAAIESDLSKHATRSSGPTEAPETTGPTRRSTV
jgi:DNA-binding IclR family transcriptional regulator